MYFVDPELLNIGEALIISQVVYEKDSVGSFVVGTGNGSEPFLTSCVPNLQLYYVIVNIEWSEWIMKVLESKIDTDGSKITLLEGVIGKSSEKWWLSNRTVAYDDNLKKIIVLLYHLINIYFNFINYKHSFFILFYLIDFPIIKYLLFRFKQRSKIIQIKINKLPASILNKLILLKMLKH